MDLVLFLLIVAYATFFQSVTGFGITVVAAPLALLFLDKTVVVSALIVVGTFLNTFLFFKIKSPVDKKVLIPLIVSSFIGMPLGILVLKFAPLNQLKVMVGLLSIVFSVSLYFSKSNLGQVKFLKPFSGFISGVLQTSTSMSGPPIALFLAGAAVPKDEFRKTLVIYFLVIDLIAIPMLYVSGLLPVQSVEFGVFSIPLILLGASLGNKVSQKIPPKNFRFLALATVFVTGLFAVYSGLF